MIEIARPFLVIYVVWHPDFEFGAKVAEALFNHFRRDNYRNITGGSGIPVLYRFASAIDGPNPLDIDFADADTSAVIVLADHHFVTDPTWMKFLRKISKQTESNGLASRMFPVAMEQGIIKDLALNEQALKWFNWNGDTRERTSYLIGVLTFQFCRMLRHYLEHLRRPDEPEQELIRYLKKVDIFLSHSKHDLDGAGEAVAQRIREKLTTLDGLGSFFDVFDIPPGMDFQKILLTQVSISAVVAIHTDSFSSREWCRREIVAAKTHNRPLIIANCISDRDERGFPYLGNVPIIRLEHSSDDRVGVVIAALLDEILRDFLWQCRVQLMSPNADPLVTFLPRPPELISLAELVPAARGNPTIVVYPDPPLGAEEERLFHAIAPNIQLRSATEWLAGAVR